MSRRGRRALGGDVWVARFVAIADAYDEGLNTVETQRRLRIRRDVIATVRDRLSRAEAQGYARAREDATVSEGGSRFCGTAPSDRVEDGSL